MQEHANEELELLDRIVADPQARRELLWLRAREHGDVFTAHDLERLDPGIQDRLRAAHGELGEHTDFRALYDQCLERHKRAARGYLRPMNL